MQQVVPGQNPPPNPQNVNPGPPPQVTFQQGQPGSQGFGQPGQFQSAGQFGTNMPPQGSSFPQNPQGSNPNMTSQNQSNIFPQAQQSMSPQQGNQQLGTQQAPLSPQKSKQPQGFGQGGMKNSSYGPPPIVISQTPQSGQMIQGVPYQNTGQGPTGQQGQAPIQNPMGMSPGGPPANTNTQQSNLPQNQSLPQQPNQFSNFPPNASGSIPAANNGFGGQPGQPGQQGQPVPGNMSSQILSQQAGPPGSGQPTSGQLANQPPPEASSPRKQMQPEPASPTKAPLENPLSESEIIKNPETYLTTNVLEEVIEGVKYNYFICEKQSKTGIKNNLRFFLVYDNQLAYSTKYSFKDGSVPFRTMSRLPKIKEKYFFENITLQSPVNGSLKLKIKKTEKQTLNWLLVAKNKDLGMMQQIFTLLLDTKNKPVSIINPSPVPETTGTPQKPLDKGSNPQAQGFQSQLSGPQGGQQGQQMPPNQAGQANFQPSGSQQYQQGPQTQGPPGLQQGPGPQQQGPQGSGLQGSQGLPGQQTSQTGQMPNVNSPQGQGMQQSQGGPQQPLAQGPPGSQFQTGPQGSQSFGPGQQQPFGGQNPQQQGPQPGMQPGMQQSMQQGMQPGMQPGMQQSQGMPGIQQGQNMQQGQGMQQGYSQGMQQGMQPGQQSMQPGMQQGMQQGMQPGMQSGMQPNMQPGMQPGMQQGMQQGMQPSSSLVSGQAPAPTQFPSHIPSADDQARLKQQFMRLDEYNRRGKQPKQGDSPQRVPRNQQPINEQFRKMYTRQVQQRKKLLYTDNQNWNYQFLKGDDEQVIFNFKKFAEALVADIIDDMSERQRTYNPSQPYDEGTQTILYEDQNGVDVKLCFTDIKDFKLIKENKQSIYDEAAIKSAFRQFNNMNYILQMTRNRGKVRVPLANIVEYKGIVALVRATIPRDDNKSAKSLLNELQLLSRESHIRENIFQEQKAINIVPLQSKFYQKLARQENSPLLRQKNVFDVYYLDNVRNFLPVDLQFAPKNPENYILRPQFLQREEFADKMFLGESMENYMEKQKVSRQVQESIRELGENTKQIIKLVDELIVEWEELNETVVNSEDISRMLHSRGINIRYLGLIYSNAKLPLVRKVCMSQIAARVAKTVLRFDLQQYLKNTILTKLQSKSKDRLTEVVAASDEMLAYSIDFLNSVAGNLDESGEVWNRLNKQALYSFNISLSKQQIAEGHLIQALLHHCKIKCGFRYQNRDRLFTRRVFERTKDSCFVVTSKNYNLGYTDTYRRIKGILEQEQIDNLQQLKSLLNLRKIDLPEHLRLDNTYMEIARFISAFLPPKSNNPSQNLPCCSVYRLVDNEIPSLTTLTLALTDIKWDLKADNLQDALKKQDILQKKIVRWCGELHPMLDDLHLTFARYYLMKGKYEESINFAKSSLANLSNLLGNNSLKTAEIHFELANIYLKSSRREQALNSFKKAKNIFDNKNQTQQLPYAQIQLKIAALDLQFDKLEQAASFTLHAIHIIEEETEHENDLVEAYELISRIYEANRRFDEVAKIAAYCGNLLSEIKDQNNLERMIKIAVYPLFYELTPRLAQKLSLLLESLPYQYQTANYSNGISFLKKLIEQNTLIEKLGNYLNQLEEVINSINNNGLVARWRGLDTDIKTKGQEFIAIMESLVYVLGDGFVSGTLDRS